MKNWILAMSLLFVSNFSLASEISEQDWDNYDVPIDINDRTEYFPADDPLEIERKKYVCDSKTLQGVTFDYCYRLIDRSSTKDIVYFFHGLGGAADTWFTQCLGTQMLQKWWSIKGYRPMIVTISFGSQWLLADNSKNKLLPYFRNVAMPFLEKQVGGLQGGRRLLIGQSMGGMNAIEASLKYPGTFQRVALLCPAISSISPFSTSREIQDYISRTRAKPHLVEKMLRISKSVFTDQNDWDRHDPLRLIRGSRNSPLFYLSIGSRDGYGFQEGSRRFVDIAKSRFFSFIWAPAIGGHCNFERRSSANFIMGE